MITFGERLKELRAEKSFKHLEKEIGIDDSTLCRWENGQLENICQSLVKIAKFFNVSIEYLLGLEN